MSDPTRPTAWRRRDLLRAGLLWAVAGPSAARAADPLDAIREKGRAAGLGAFRTAETGSFVGVGDAPAAFMDESLAACEALAADYRKLFGKRGFDLTAPAEKLRVVVLSSSKAYAAFDRTEDPGSEVGGHYDLTDNYQVTFDSRVGAKGPPGAAERVNSFTLVHETTHQLTFNTGVLDRAGDVPVAVSEGLATFAETWRPRGRGEIGQVNRFRLDARRGARWIPVARLLAEDGLFEAEATQNAAYAEAYLLAHWFLKDPGRTAKYVAYLAALRKNADPKRREAMAAEHLGDLARLDRVLPRSN